MKNIVHSRYVVGMVMLAAAAFMACESSTSTDPESRAGTLTVETVTTTIPVQGETELTAILRNRAGDDLDREVRWGTHTPSLVSVDSVGRKVRVRGLSPGTAVVWAAGSGLEETVTIIVTGAAEKVEVTPATTGMPLGTSLQFQAFVRDAQNNILPNPSVGWSTSSPTILSTSPTGVVTAIGVGTAQVTATINGRSGSAQVTVTPTAVATVLVAPNPGEATLGRTIQFFPTLKDAAGNVLTGRDVAWNSSNPSVLEVSASGLGQARTLGNAVITATSEGRSGTTQVSVVPQSSLLIEVFPASASINPGESQNFSATSRNSAGTVVTGLPVSWASSDPSVATMTAVGVATAIAPGVTTITAIVDGRSGSTQLSVRSPVPTLSGVSPDTITAGRVSDLTIAATGANFTRISKVRWNGTDRPTEYQSATRLLATITAADLEEPRTAAVTVVTPAPGGGITTQFQFQVKSRNANIVGDTIQDELRPAGDVDDFRFEGRAGDEVNVYFQSMSGAYNQEFSIELYDPRADRIGYTYSRGTDQTLEGQAFGPVRLPRDGTYTLRVQGYQGTEQGRYRIYVMPINLAPERIGKTFAVGTVVGGETIAPVGDIDEFTFNATKGQLVNVFFQSTSGSATEQLHLFVLSPTRTVIESVESDGGDRTLDGQSTGRFEIPLSGIYTLRIQGDNPEEDGGEYRMQVVTISPGPESLPSAFTAGTVVTGESISPRGDSDDFTFTGVAQQEVTVFFQATSGEPSSEFALYLLDPSDAQLGYAYSRGSNTTLEGQGFGPKVLPRTGTYTIRVRGYNGTEQGPYKFRVMPVNLAPERISAVTTAGPVVTGEDLSPVGDIDHFSFTATRGQAINVQFQATSGLANDQLYLELRDPSGRALKSLTSSGSDTSLDGQQTGRVVLDQSGTYVVRIQANYWGGQGPYSFRVIPLQ